MSSGGFLSGVVLVGGGHRSSYRAAKCAAKRSGLSGRSYGIVVSLSGGQIKDKEDGGSTAGGAPTESSPPPSTFYQAIRQAQDAITTAIENGEYLLEVEFPPLPAAMMENSAVGAYQISDANYRLAVDVAKRFADEGERVVMAFPDLIEKDRILEQNGDRQEVYPNIRLGTIRDEFQGSFLERLWSKPALERAIRDDDSMFFVLGASAQELPAVESLARDVGSRPVILFNLKLDTSRGDLGLPAFPSKRLHYEFLSRVLPVYYLRPRAHSRSIPRPPYIVNYSGALFRVYPGEYQVLLDSEGGQYRRVQVSTTRPTLGEVRDALTSALMLEDAGSILEKLRSGYKSTTWWEEDTTIQESNKWRE